MAAPGTDMADLFGTVEQQRNAAGFVVEAVHGCGDRNPLTETA